MNLGERKAPPVLPISEKPLLDVEGLNDARTKLAVFFSSLLVQLLGDGVCLEDASCRESAALTVFFDQLLRE